MNVLLTGASGFLGRNLLLRLPAGWSVVATYRRSIDFERFVTERCDATQVQTIQCDLEDPDSIASAMARVGRNFDLCVFLAANTSVPLSVEDPAVDLRANTLTLLNTLGAVTIDRFVFMSSGAVYDGVVGPVGVATPVCPSLPYAISKLASELYLRNSHAQGRLGSYAIIRFFGAYGPYEPRRKIYSRLVRELGIERRNDFTIYGDGLNLVDAMYVDDAITALLKVSDDKRTALLVDAAYGQPMMIKELVDRAARLFLGRPVHLELKGVAHEAIHFKPDPAVLEHMVKFKPAVTLEQGLEKLLQHHLHGAS